MIKVILLDTKTMQTVEVSDNISGFEWAENNWSCDCNRANYFGNVADELEQNIRDKHPGLKEYQSYCYGSNRFLLIYPFEGIDGYTLEELNGSYPDDLVRKYLTKNI